MPIRSMPTRQHTQHNGRQCSNLLRNQRNHRHLLIRRHIRLQSITKLHRTQRKQRMLPRRKPLSRHRQHIRLHIRHLSHLTIQRRRSVPTGTIRLLRHPTIHHIRPQLNIRTHLRHHQRHQLHIQRSHPTHRLRPMLTIHHNQRPSFQFHRHQSLMQHRRLLPHSLSHNNYTCTIRRIRSQ